MRPFIAVLLALLAVRIYADDPRLRFPPNNDVREIRAGVICFGGVSLAIYMYGNARELHHLAQASAALECDATKAESQCVGVTPGKAFDTLDRSAKEYYGALVDRWREDGVRPHFIIDVISGTSAGGINGVFLAKALTHNAPLDGLREIWFREADIARLAGRPWIVRSLWRLIRHRAALGGDAWLQQLYLALEDMDREPTGPRLASLLTPEQRLDLLVTATDFYGTERILEIGDPATSSELRYDHVFRFAAGRDSRGNVPEGDFDGAKKDKLDNIALAFAARSSASFPVAFPAIRPEQLRKALRDETIDTIALADRLFKDRIISTDGVTAKSVAQKLYLVDGGVLDNHPFGLAHNAVSRRTPRRETQRVYLYLEPDPRVIRIESPANPDQGPTPVEMFWNARTKIPGAQPITGDLLDIRQHNRSVQRIAEILRNDDALARTETYRAAGAEPRSNEPKSIAARVEEALGLDKTALGQPDDLARDLSASKTMQRYRASGDEMPPDPGLARIHAVRALVERDAASGAPLIEDAYKRLRVESVLDQFARVMATSPDLCRLPATYDGPRLSLMQELVRQWAKSDAQKLTGSGADPQRREDFLEAFDAGYLRRRLRFVNDWLNLQYPSSGDPKIGLSREHLQLAQASIGTGVDRLSDCLRGGCLARVPADVLARAKEALCAYDDQATPAQQAEKILRENAPAIDALVAAAHDVLLQQQNQVLADLYEAFVVQSKKWKNEKAARAVLAHYLGFPHWDRVAYPYVAFSDIGDMTRIEIVRMSPNDTTALSDDKAGKLAGSTIGHFGAFFKPEGRQKDYLWGRLDGAERLLSSVLRFGDDAARRTRLFQAILKEEREAAKVSAASLAELQKCVDAGRCPDPKQ
jgi:patatin-related protein